CQASSVHQRRRNRCKNGVARLAPGALIIAEEEKLVFDDGTAHRTAELVPESAGNEPAGDRTGCCLREGIGRLRGITTAEFKEAAVEAIATGLGLRGYDAGNGAAKFRIVVLGGDFRLGDRFQCGIDDDDAKNRILIVCSIQLVGSAAEVLSVHKG